MQTLYFDTEGTGFSHAKGDRLVEIAILGEDGTVLLSSLVNPQRRIPWQAQNVHHISDAMVRNAPTWDQVAPKVAVLLEGAHLVGHNTKFDLSFLGGLARLPAKTTCTLEMAKSRVEGKRNLERLAQLAGHKAQGGYHRAAADALATRSVHLWLCGMEAPPAKHPKSDPKDSGAPAARSAKPSEKSIQAAPSPRFVGAPATAATDPRVAVVPVHLCPEPVLRGKPWTSDSDSDLLALWSGGFSLPAILAHIPRTPTAIFCRLVQLGAVAEASNPYARRY